MLEWPDGKAKAFTICLHDHFVPVCSEGDKETKFRAIVCSIGL